MMSQEQLGRKEAEAEACRQAERDAAMKDNPAVLKQDVGKSNHDKLCDIVTERMQHQDNIKDNLASLSVAAAKDTKCKRS